MLSTFEKLEILGAAAKYDASCSSSGSARTNATKGLGNACSSGICHSWTDDGRCISLLKVLLSNYCIYDCAYCMNRRSNDVPRAAFTPHELAELTVEFYKRNYIEGLFLSSGVVKSPDYTMELFVRTLSILRFDMNFNGYIHVKVIPSSSPELIDKVGLLADRISVNMELATKSSMKLLAPDKTHEDILTPMDYIKYKKLQSIDEKRRFRSAPKFAPAGQTTQLIVGATPEHDLTVLRLAEGLYNRYDLKRVFYSAYIPVGKHPALPKTDTSPPLLREHRIYQADWLLRFYGFSAKEILNEQNPDLDLEVDPKCSFALKNPQLYPVEVNTADYEALLRVPGIGVTSAKRIVASRRFGSLDETALRKMGVVLKRARYFITVKGKRITNIDPSSPILKEVLKDYAPSMQTSIFDPNYQNLISVYPAQSVQTLNPAYPILTR